MTNLRCAGIAATLILAAACGGSGGSGSADGTEAPAPRSAALSQAADCEDLLTGIRADARAKIRIQADELRRGGWTYAGGGVPAPVATFAPLPTPAASPPPAAGAPDATDTNTQVPGVDEADLMEIADGRLYLLRGDALVIVDAVPPEATAIRERIALEGAPLGMFVADGRALVVSFVIDDGSLGGDPRCDAIGAPFPLWDEIENPWHDFVPPIYPPCQSFFTKLTLLDVASTPARVLREVWVEGSYVAARRHGTRARVVVQRGWGVPPGVADPWSVLWPPRPVDEDELVARVDAWERSALAAVDASTLADWLPTVRERVGGALAERTLTCDHAAAPAAGEAPQGATLIVGLDLASADAPLDDALVLGQALQIYANADTLVLAQPEWQPEPLGDAETRTALHVFALGDDGAASYRGSGFVPGSVLSQFSMDVRGDVVRVATSFLHATRGTTVTRVTTATVRAGALVTLGASDDLAPGEPLQAARFVGDRAYLVTFVRVDPLFVVDLADPTQPRVLGELELPGFSEYVHPLDDDHLLTIGRGAREAGMPVALRLFDVADPAAPRLAAGYDLPVDAYTPAESNHLAFVFDARRGLLALPVTVYEGTTQATLDLFHVDAAAGITLAGVVDHGPPRVVPCFPPYDDGECTVVETMERGVFIGDAVYSIGSVMLQVHALDDLGEPLATVTW